MSGLPIAELHAFEDALLAWRCRLLIRHGWRVAAEAAARHDTAVRNFALGRAD